jgi:hypothetical protein
VAAMLRVNCPGLSGMRFFRRRYSGSVVMPGNQFQQKDLFFSAGFAHEMKAVRYFPVE